MYWLAWQLFGVVLVLAAAWLGLALGAWIIARLQEPHNRSSAIRLIVGMLGLIGSFWLLFWQK